MSRTFDPIGLFYWSLKRHVEDATMCRRRLMILRDAKRRRLIRKLENKMTLTIEEVAGRPKGSWLSHVVKQEMERM